MNNISASTWLMRRWELDALFLFLHHLLCFYFINTLVYVFFFLKFQSVNDSSCRYLSAPRRPCKRIQRVHRSAALQGSPTSSSAATRSSSSSIACRRSRRGRREHRRRTRMKKATVREGDGWSTPPPHPHLFCISFHHSFVTHHMSPCFCCRWFETAAGGAAQRRGEGAAQGGVHHSDAPALPRRQRQGFRLQVSHTVTHRTLILHQGCLCTRQT